ncbi:hypothetical protein ABZP36_011779 [Zizania latifolia]
MYYNVMKTLVKAYVTQDNVLTSTLSVREAVYYSAHLQLPDTMPSPEKRAHAERVIREMGLGDAMDTRIGGRVSRGISGGQRKRVSICVEMLTRPRLLFLDEPTSGLDSAASYHVMSHIARVAAREAMTVIAAVHQPSGDVFELFQRLCLLAYGRTVFFGTVSDATEETAESSNAKRKTAAEATDILTNAYQSSTYSEKTASQIVEMKGMGGAPFRRKEQASFSTKLLVLTKRSFINMHRDIGYYWMRLGIYMGMGICIGTIFYQVGYTYSSIQTRCEVIMYTTALLTFMAIGGFPSFVEDIKVVFRRERLSGHYGVVEFVVSNTLSAAPYLAFIAVLPGAMLYYLTGLTRGAEHLAYFVAMLCMCTLLVESMMMIVAVVVPDFLMGIIVGAGVQGVMMLNGGFFRLPKELPKPVWRYPCYYISFHKYAVQGFYKNEFLGLSFPSDQLVDSNATVSGLQVLEKLQVEMGYSKWVNLAILFGMMVIYRTIFFAIVKVAEDLRPKLRGMRFRWKFRGDLKSWMKGLDWALISGNELTPVLGISRCAGAGEEGRSLGLNGAAFHRISLARECMVQSDWLATTNPIGKKRAAGAGELTWFGWSGKAKHASIDGAAAVKAPVWPGRRAFVGTEVATGRGVRPWLVGRCQSTATVVGCPASLAPPIWSAGEDSIHLGDPHFVIPSSPLPSSSPRPRLPAALLPRPLPCRHRLPSRKPPQPHLFLS